MSKRLKLSLLVIGVIIVVGIVSLLVYLKIVDNYRDKVANTQIKEISISEIQDGTYIGDYDVGFIYAKAEVSVNSGKITDIKLLEHKNGQGEPAEVIVDSIIKAQSLEVDAVSGATNSCIVIKKAIEIALLKANN